MIYIDSLPDYEAEARKWEDLYNRAKDKNNCLCEELEKLKKALDMKHVELEELKIALDKKSVELNEKQRECDMYLASTIKLQGQVEAYKFCIGHWRGR